VRSSLQRHQHLEGENAVIRQSLIAVLAFVNNETCSACMK